MNTSINNYDALEQLIFGEGLQINKIEFRPEADLMLIELNTKAILQQKLSTYPILSKADISQLSAYQIIANGTGVHWSELDEDLSLKGFLQAELLTLVRRRAA